MMELVRLRQQQQVRPAHACPSAGQCLTCPAFCASVLCCTELHSPDSASLLSLQSAQPHVLMSWRRRPQHDYKHPHTSLHTAAVQDRQTQLQVSECDCDKQAPEACTDIVVWIVQNTDQETKRLLARLESTEQRQQQMMAFLAKAVQNPAFLQELLTNQRHAQRISGPDKSESLSQRAGCAHSSISLFVYHTQRQASATAVSITWLKSAQGDCASCRL